MLDQLEVWRFAQVHAVSCSLDAEDGDISVRFSLSSMPQFPLEACTPQFWRVLLELFWVITNTALLPPPSPPPSSLQRQALKRRSCEPITSAFLPGLLEWPHLYSWSLSHVASKVLTNVCLLQVGSVCWSFCFSPPPLRKVKPLVGWTPTDLRIDKLHNSSSYQHGNPYLPHYFFLSVVFRIIWDVL